MAEGDKFEQRLRGFGWRRAYKLAKAGARVPMVVDALMISVSHALRNDLACPRLADILNILQFSLQTGWQEQSSEDDRSPEASPFSCLCVELERIEAIELGSITARLASEAAQAVFAELQSVRDVRSTQQVKNCFAEELTRRIIDNRWLSHVREGIVIGAEHTAAQHEQWKADLYKTLRPQAHALFNSMIKRDGSQAVARAPRRLTPRKKLTKESLHQPLEELVR